MIKAVILDLDDTLCLTEEACFNMENEVLISMGRKAMPRDLHRSTWGRPLFEAIVDRSPGIDIDLFRKAYEPLIDEYVTTGKLDAIPPENVQALKQLAASGKSLLVLTSRENSELAHILKPAHVLSGHIETFYFKDNMQYHKPDPRAFAHIEHQHGWKPNECIYVGDSIGDAVSAKGAGLWFIASLESGLRTRLDFADYAVDAYVQVFPEVVKAVQMIDELEKASNG